jgi:hypothetical protein
MYARSFYAWLVHSVSRLAANEGYAVLGIALLVVLCAAMPFLPAGNGCDN